MKGNCMDRNDVAVIRHEKVNSITLFIIGAIFIALYAFLNSRMLIFLIVGICVIALGIVFYTIKTTFYLRWIEEGVILVKETRFLDEISYELKLNEVECQFINDEILEIKDKKNHFIRVEKNSKVFQIFEEQLKINHIN